MDVLKAWLPWLVVSIISTADDVHFKIATELIKNNVLVLATGCAAQALGRRGLMSPEAAAEYAGEGLAEVWRR